MSIKITRLDLCYLSIILPFALPLYNANNIGLLLCVPVFLYVGLIGIRNMIKELHHLNKVERYLLWLYFIGVIIASVIGLIKGYKIRSYWLYYVFAPSVYWTIKYMLYRGVKTEKLLTVAYYSGLFSAFFNLIMIMTPDVWGVTEFIGNRVGGSYETIYVATFCFGQYLLLSRRKKIPLPLHITGICVAITDLVLAQSRSSFLVFVVGIIIVSTIKYRGKSNKVTLRSFIIKSLILLVISIGLYQVVNGTSDFASRLVNTDVESKNDSFIVRYLIYTTNLEMFYKEPWGNGFGTPFTFVDGYGHIKFTDLEYVDNTYVTMAVHGGIALVCSFLFIILGSIYSSFKKRKFDRPFCDTLLVIFILYVFTASIGTSQSLHEVSPNVMMWFLISVMVNGFPDSANQLKDRNKIVYCIKG